MPGWQIHTHGMPRISSFAEAEKFWNGQEPWTNKLTSWRPLDSRRASHKRIVRINDGDAYMCVLYNTPLVTYHNNGDVELQTFNSSSSQIFAWRIRPEHCTVESVDATMYWGYPSQEGIRYVRQAEEPLYLEYVGTRQYNLVSKPAETFEWDLDRKAAAGVRARLSHYDKWEKLTSRLTGTRAIGKYHTCASLASIAALLAEPERIELFPIYREELGPVEDFRQIAYEIAGARTKTLAPYDRLPRRQR